MSLKAYLTAAVASIAFTPLAANAMVVLDLGGVGVPSGQEGQATGQVYVDLPAGAISDPFNADFSQTGVFGIVDTIRPFNPLGAFTFVSGATELTYSLDITSFTAPVVNGNLLTTEIEATVTYYVDTTTSFSELNPSTGTDGDIWLTATLAGVETIELNLTNGQISATDLEFDVTGGLFAENFDQNFFGGNDFVTFSFQTFGQSDPGSVSLFNGATNTRFFAIPEPSTVGLLGLGLVGLGMVSRRRKS